MICKFLKWLGNKLGCDRKMRPDITLSAAAKESIKSIHSLKIKKGNEHLFISEHGPGCNCGGGPSGFCAGPWPEVKLRDWGPYREYIRKNNPDIICGLPEIWHDQELQDALHKRFEGKSFLEVLRILGNHEPHED